MDDDTKNMMSDLLAHSLEGNALGVRDAVDSMLSAKAIDAIQSMKIDVAQSIYGNYASDDDASIDTEIDPDEDVDYDIPEDDEFEDLFAEIEDLTGEEEDSLEEPTEGEDDEDV